MSDTEETLATEPEEGTTVEESDSELGEVIDDLASEGDGESEVSDDDIEIDGKRLTKKELAELVAKRDNLQKDYTQKTMALAEERKQVEQYKQQQAQAYQQLEQARSVLHSELNEFQGVDWVRVAEQDAENGTNHFSILRAQYEQRLAKAEQIEMARENYKSQQMNEGIKELLAAVPELADPVKSKQATESMMQHLKHYGIDDFDDPRYGRLIFEAVSNADKAKKYDEMMGRVEAKRRANASSNAPEPSAKVRTATSKGGLDDSLTADEWAKRRNAQLKNRR